MQKFPILKAAALTAGGLALGSLVLFWFPAGDQAAAEHRAGTSPTPGVEREDFTTRESWSASEHSGTEPATSSAITAALAERNAHYSESWPRNGNAGGMGNGSDPGRSAAPPKNRLPQGSRETAPIFFHAPIVISGGGQGGPEIEVPAGTPLPAVLLDIGQSTEAQIATADAIADAYAGDVARLAANGQPQDGKAQAGDQKARQAGNEAATLDAARDAADERYRAIFGKEDYLIHTAAAAAKALKEKGP